MSVSLFCKDSPAAQEVSDSTPAEAPMAERLRVNEIFYSLQGESTTAGLPTVFIRLTGCPLRCTYCDTEYAFQGGQWMNLDSVLQHTADYTPRYVTVTGGEPLAQRACLPLLKRLCDQGYTVSLETSGALDISNVDERVIVVMDLKTPSSGEVDKNRYQNLRHLKAADQVKFVISGRSDYEWAREQIKAHGLHQRCQVLFSPAYNVLEPAELAAWILQDRLPVRLQLQLHKLLWGDVPGR